ncbi:hypothetical protein ASE14_16535 [Agromyces sp. Root81]|uniref:hypothetical protein n=1 Tax=Agromyces sp. Root81 TaxID=1736601 RepID=UPI0006F7FEB4|nr:hypothetical protein [Agromyces sp. Root81]KRC59343.1 hypothetical protein ASE14_16535 [Agromyces sp. Root81]
MTTRSSRGARAGLAFTGLALLLALSACAPNASDSADLKSGDSDAAYEEWSADFASCMKDEGIDIQMATSADGSSTSSDSTEAVDPDEVDLDAMAAAERTCFDKVGDPPPIPGMPDADELNEASLRFSACLRERGYDFDDPKISSDGSVGMTEAMSADEIDPADAEACNKEADFPTVGEE